MTGPTLAALIAGVEARIALTAPKYTRQYKKALHFLRGQAIEEWQNEATEHEREEELEAMLEQWLEDEKAARQREEEEAWRKMSQDSNEQQQQQENDEKLFDEPGMAFWRDLREGATCQQDHQEKAPQESDDEKTWRAASADSSDQQATDEAEKREHKSYDESESDHGLRDKSDYETDDTSVGSNDQHAADEAPEQEEQNDGEPVDDKWVDEEVDGGVPMPQADEPVSEPQEDEPIAEPQADEHIAEPQADEPVSEPKSLPKFTGPVPDEIDLNLSSRGNNFHATTSLAGSKRGYDYSTIDSEEVTEALEPRQRADFYKTQFTDVNAIIMPVPETLPEKDILNYMYHGTMFLKQGRKSRVPAQKVFIRLERDHSKLVMYQDSTCEKDLKMSKYLYCYQTAVSETNNTTAGSKVAPSTKTKATKAKNNDVFQYHETIHVQTCATNTTDSDFNLTVVGKKGSLRNVGVEKEIELVHRIWMRGLNMLFKEQVTWAKVGENGVGSEEEVPVWMMPAYV